MDAVVTGEWQHEKQGSDVEMFLMGEDSGVDEFEVKLPEIQIDSFDQGQDCGAEVAQVVISLVTRLMMVIIEKAKPMINMFWNLNYSLTLELLSSLVLYSSFYNCYFCSFSYSKIYFDMD